MEKLPLAPGFTLRHFKTHNFLTRTYALRFRLPLTRADAAAHALLPGVLRRGCRDFPAARDITRRAEALHGASFAAEIAKKGEEQLLSLTLETTRDVPAADALGFLRAVLLEPLTDGGAFRPAYVNEAREALRKVILSRANDKRAYARLRCLEELCRDEPFGIYGDGCAEDLDGFTPESLYARYEAVLSGAAECITVGDADADDLAAHIQNALPLPRKRAAPPPAADFAVPEQPARAVDESTDAAQGKLCLGIRTGVPPTGQAYCDLLAANALFGGGGDSRLFTQVREKARLCYYASSSYYRFKGILLAECGLDAADFPRAEEMIGKELDAMRTGQFTHGALDKAKRSLSRWLRTLSDDPAALVDFTMAQIIARDDRGVSEVVRGVEAVTPEGCQAAFANARLGLTYRLAQRKGESENA